MNNQFLDSMLELAKEAGGIARQLIGTEDVRFKPDHSVLTAADQAISQLSHARLASFLTQSDHLLIDEEDVRKSEYLNAAFLKSKRYIWVVDPIDGTRLYANQMPLHAFSLGLLKDLKPWLGAVYFPALQELFYCDGERSFFVRNPFTPKEERREITPKPMGISSRSLFLMSDMFFKRFEWDYSDCRLMVTACATVNLCWPTIGRGCGSMDQSYLWDFAGSWPIARSAGLDLRNLRTGEILDHVDVDCFCPSSPWRLNEYHILSSEKNFPVFQNKIKQKADGLF
jgi:fructose-1,6-bisphosphatase/inositol monophosphatase family enzyme